MDPILFEISIQNFGLGLFNLKTFSLVHLHSLEQKLKGFGGKMQIITGSGISRTVNRKVKISDKQSLALKSVLRLSEVCRKY